MDDDIKRAGALFAVAEEQQKTAELHQAAVDRLIGVLSGETVKVGTAAKALELVTNKLNTVPATLEKTVATATENSVRLAVGQAAKDVTTNAKQAAEAAAQRFNDETRRATETVDEAITKAQSVMQREKWWKFGIAFLFGIFCGSAGLWLLHSPEVKTTISCQPSPVTLDPAAMAKLLQPALIAECRRR
jgi:ElaB/YqjD/DUF883 family membrane-anchored ribosome-binding protein